MDDNAMFDYLLQMGAMQPEQSELKRKQAMVEALRQSAMTPQQGQMVSGHYVAPGIGGALNQLMSAYMAKQGQGQVDQGMAGMNARQREMLEALRKKRKPTQMMPPSVDFDPYGGLPTYGSEA